MHAHDVKRLVVVGEDGTLLGIVSRRDLLGAFTRADEEIRLDIVEGVLPRWLGIDPKPVDVSVAGGIVLLRGGLPRRSDIEILVALVTGLDGVVEVDSQLRYDFDDGHLKAATEAHVS
jgi:CBS domain-containing protein